MGAYRISGTSFINKMGPSADRGEVPGVEALARDGFHAGGTPGHGQGPWPLAVTMASSHGQGPLASGHGQGPWTLAMAPDHGQ